MSKNMNEHVYRNKKEAKINEYLDELLRDLDELEKYAPYDTKLAKERQSKTQVLHNKYLTNQIFDFAYSTDELFASEEIQKQIEKNEKYRYESLKRMFEYKPKWLINLIKKPQSKMDITDNISEEEKEREYERQDRILSYYKEFKELEKKYKKTEQSEESKKLKSKIKNENRQMDLLKNVSKYLENKHVKSKSGGTRKSNRISKRISYKKIK